MTFKKRLLTLMQELADRYQSPKITVILCIQAEQGEWPTIYGYRNPESGGSIMTVMAPEPIIKNVLASSWEQATTAQP